MHSKDTSLSSQLFENVIVGDIFDSERRLIRVFSYGIYYSSK